MAKKEDEARSTSVAKEEHKAKYVALTKEEMETSAAVAKDETRKCPHSWRRRRTSPGLWPGPRRRTRAVAYKNKEEEEAGSVDVVME